MRRDMKATARGVLRTGVPERDDCSSMTYNGMECRTRQVWKAGQTSVAKKKNPYYCHGLDKSSPRVRGKLRWNYATVQEDVSPLLEIFRCMSATGSNRMQVVCRAEMEKSRI